MIIASYTRLGLLLCLVLSPLLAPRALAQRPATHWVPYVEARKNGSAGELVVNNMVVMRFQNRQSGLYPLERAQKVANSLTEVLQSNERGSVRVDDSNPDQPVLRFGRRTIAAVNAESVPKVKSRRRQRRLLRTARANAYAQVARWAGTLKAALARPGLTLSASSGLIPLTETRSFSFGGVARGPVRVTSDAASSGTVSWQVDAISKAVSVQGIKPGRETLYVERDGAVVPLTVTVRPYAGQLTAPRPVIVTGNSTPPDIIGRLARVAAITSASLTPGATLRILSDSLDVSSLRAGQAAMVVVPVRLWGPEMIAVQRKVFVPIVNRRLSAVPTTTLFYSNNPERVTEPQVLFTGRLPAANEVARLLYHHQNAVARAFHFTVELLNDGDAPTEVQMVGGDAGPERDTVWVGFRAAADYIAAAENGVGAVVNIPSQMHVSLSSLRLPAGQTISGLMHLRTLTGAPPLVRIVAEPATIITHMPFLPLPLDKERREANATENLSEHVYPNPSQTLEAEYKVGGAWTFIKYGRVGITASTSPRTVLHGNYGVFYDIKLTLQNPTATPARARLVFEPSAGMAGGIFLIGKRKVEIPQSNMPNETTLASYTLEPGERRNVTVRTLPLSGSNYPATLIVRP